MILSILEGLRLKLRMIQFPKEENLKKGLLIIMKKIVERLNNRDIQKMYNSRFVIYVLGIVKK